MDADKKEEPQGSVTPQKTEDYRNLEELKKQQEELRYHIRRLSARRPWFLQVGNWLGLLGIVVALTVYLVSRERKEMTVTWFQPRSILKDAGFTSSRALINLDGRSYADLQKLTIMIRNSGNRGISSQDFPGGPLRFTVTTRPNESGEMTDTNCLVSVVQPDATEEAEGELALLNGDSLGSFTFLPPLLNKGDYVQLDVYMKPSNFRDVSVYGRLLDGTLQVNSAETAQSTLQAHLPSAMRNVLGGRVLGRVIPLVLFVVFCFLLFVHYQESAGWDYLEDIIGAAAIGLLILFSATWSVVVLFF